MFNIILKILLLIFFSILIVFPINSVVAKKEYTPLSPYSSSFQIKKYQKFFKALKIYNWNIDGKYSSIKNSIIIFQIKHKIIKNKSEDWAWYIWPKTHKALSQKFWKNFEKAYSKYFAIKYETLKQWTQRHFIVSAYYSPLPWQKRYSTWSYAGDIRLNGNWTHWASWVKVHPWFIAAPYTYKFWTKIQLEWLWIWTVEDRWWAIVKAWRRWHEYDRLDIWMWYGDSWLTKALNWGKRTVKWKILASSAKNTIKYSWTKTIKSNRIAIKITPKSSNSNIKLMQKLFSEAKIYQWVIDGRYSNFKPSIINFQIKHKVIPYKHSIWNWYIGNKTIAKLEEKYPKVFLTNRRKTQIEVQEKKKKLVKKPDTKSEIKLSPSVKKKYNISSQQKKEVEKIQVILEKALKKKYWNNHLKLKTQKTKLLKRIIILIEKIKKESTKEKLKYLHDLISEKIK